jgi:alanyl-tRNA synthetase
MTTRKLYLAMDDLECRATITDVADLGDRQRVRCTQTVFHPQGGGQKADRGTICGLPVADVRHAEDGEVDHFVLSGAFAEAEEVDLCIDGAWRDESCRWHSAGHLIADCVLALDPRLTPVRGHHWPGEARVEFLGDAVGLGVLSAQLPNALARMISDQVPFTIVGDPYRSRALRIGENEPVGCGGTHVRSAGMLAGLQIRKIQQKEGLLRISYTFADKEPES